MCLRSAYIALGYACNHGCIFCPCGTDRPRNMALTIDEFEQSIGSIIACGAHGVIISGGEPTLQPLFFDYLKKLSSSNLHVELLSNADTLSDSRLVSKILSIINATQLSITSSIHSHKPEIHDNITRSPGSWSRSIQGLQNAQSQGLKVTVKHCIAKQNYQDMSSFVDFIYSTFPDNVGLLFCSIDYCGLSSEAAAAVAVDFKNEGKYIEQALDRVIYYRDVERRARNVMVTDTPLCCVDPYYWSFFPVFLSTKFLHMLHRRTMRRTKQTCKFLVIVARFLKFASVVTQKNFAPGRGVPLTNYLVKRRLNQ